VVRCVRARFSSWGLNPRSLALCTCTMRQHVTRPDIFLLCCSSSAAHNECAGSGIAGFLGEDSRASQMDHHDQKAVRTVDMQDACIRHLGD
jgi:hypothetical protein